MPALWCCDEWSVFPFPPAQKQSQGRCSLAPGRKSSTPTWIFPWSSKCCHETRTQTLVAQSNAGYLEPAPILTLSGTCSVPKPPEPGVCAHSLLQTCSRRHKSLRERSQTASSAAHSCEQMPPAGAKAWQSSPECSFEDISAVQLSFHLCVFFSPPLLSWSFKTNKVSRTRQRDNHPLIPFPRLSRLFGDSAAAGGAFTERKAGASHRAPEPWGGNSCLGFSFSVPWMR